MWNRIKNTEGKYKYDIDSIIDEQIKCYSKLFTTEGWDENSANKLTQHIEFFSSLKIYRVVLSPSSAHFILERIFAASAFCV
jgi:hypothetical protein